MSRWLSAEWVSLLFTRHPTAVTALSLPHEIVSVSVCGYNRTLPLPVPVITYTSALLFPPLCLTLILRSRLLCQPRNPSQPRPYSRHSLSSPWPFINCMPLAHWMPTLLDVLAACLCLSGIFSRHNCFVKQLPRQWWHCFVEKTACGHGSAFYYCCMNAISCRFTSWTGHLSGQIYVFARIDDTFLWVFIFFTLKYIHIYLEREGERDSVYTERECIFIWSHFVKSHSILSHPNLKIPSCFASTYAPLGMRTFWSRSRWDLAVAAGLQPLTETLSVIVWPRVINKTDFPICLLGLYMGV